MSSSARSSFFYRLSKNRNSKVLLFVVVQFLFVLAFSLSIRTLDRSVANMLLIFPPTIMAFLFGLRMGALSYIVSFALFGFMSWIYSTYNTWMHLAGLIGLCVEFAVVYLIGRMRDMSNALQLEIQTRQLTQQALVGTEKKYQILVERATDGIAILEEGKLSYGNPRMGQILGAPASDLIGSTFSDFVIPGQQAMFKSFVKTPTSDVTSVHEAILAITLIRVDGNEIQVEMNLGPVSIEEDESTLIFVRDLSERKRAQEEKQALEETLRQAQKLESLGRLAGGVAHDMNNVLSAILSSATVLRDDTDPLDARRNDIDNILSATKRGGALTRDLLGFARKGKYTKEKVVLNDVVHSTLALLGRTIPKNVEIESQLETGAWAVEADRNQLAHALMNVCLNSVDALANKRGTIRIRTGNLRVEDGSENEQNPVPPGKYAMLEITDDGVGMSDDVLSQAFEPFFTTKELGEGAGLGLSMVYGVVRNHGGLVSIDSTPKEGTKVTMLFPSVSATGSQVVDISSKVPSKSVQAAADEVQLIRTDGEQAKPVAVTGGCVLLVDDEAMIRNATKRFLMRLGYTVRLAKTGEEALTIYEREQDKIDVVLLDMIMPQMDGYETYTHLKDKWPDVKVILLSGYCADSKVDELIGAGAEGFLQKPVDLDVLSKELARAMGRNGLL